MQLGSLADQGHGFRLLGGVDPGKDVKAVGPAIEPVKVAVFSLSTDAKVLGLQDVVAEAGLEEKGRHSHRHSVRTGYEAARQYGYARVAANPV